MEMVCNKSRTQAFVSNSFYLRPNPMKIATDIANHCIVTSYSEHEIRFEVQIV